MILLYLSFRLNRLIKEQLASCMSPLCTSILKPFLDQTVILGYAGSADPVQMLQNVAASNQGLHCLLTGISTNYNTSENIHQGPVVQN